MNVASLKTVLQSSVIEMALLSGAPGPAGEVAVEPKGSDADTISTGVQQTGSETYVLPTPLNIDPEVKHGVKGIETLLNTLGMVRKMRLWGDPEPVYYRSTWVRANRGGILLADVSLGSTVREGDLLGTITDPMNNASSQLLAPFSGRIIGMARNQVVMPGFAAFHIGIQTAETPAIESAGNDPLAHESGSDDYVDGMSE